MKGWWGDLPEMSEEDDVVACVSCSSSFDTILVFSGEALLTFFAFLTGIAKDVGAQGFGELIFLLILLDGRFGSRRYGVSGVDLGASARDL